MLKIKDLKNTHNPYLPKEQPEFDLSFHERRFRDSVYLKLSEIFYYKQDLEVRIEKAKTYRNKSKLLKAQLIIFNAEIQIYIIYTNIINTKMVDTGDVYQLYEEWKLILEYRKLCEQAMKSVKSKRKSKYI